MNQALEVRTFPVPLAVDQLEPGGALGAELEVQKEELPVAVVPPDLLRQGQQLV